MCGEGGYRVSSLDSAEIIEGMLPENRFDERSLYRHEHSQANERRMCVCGEGGYRVSSPDSAEIVEGMLPENRFDERSLYRHEHSRKQEESRGITGAKAYNVISCVIVARPAGQGPLN